MRHLSIPCNTLQIVGGGGAESEGVRGVIDVVNEELTLDTSSSQDLRPQWVELQRLDGTGVLRGTGDESILSSVDKLFSIPKVERAILEGAGNNTLGVVFGGRAPSDVVKSSHTHTQ